MREVTPRKQAAPQIAGGDSLAVTNGSWPQYVATAMDKGTRTEEAKFNLTNSRRAQRHEVDAKHDVLLVRCSHRLSGDRDVSMAVCKRQDDGVRAGL